MHHQKNFKNIFSMLAIVLISFFVATNTFAQFDDEYGIRRPPSIKAIPGIRAGYDYDADVWSLGGHLMLPLGRQPGGLRIIPSGDVFFINGGVDWQINLDFAIHLMMLYGGAGLAYFNRDFKENAEINKKTGTNYFIGMPIMLPIRRLRILPFVEARWTQVEDHRLFRVVAGVNILPGGRR